MTTNDPTRDALAAVLRVAALQPTDLADVLARVLRDVAEAPARAAEAERDAAVARVKLAEKVIAELRDERDGARDALAKAAADRDAALAALVEARTTVIYDEPAAPAAPAGEETAEQRRARLNRERQARFRAKRAADAAARAPAPSTPASPLKPPHVWIDQLPERGFELVERYAARWNAATNDAERADVVADAEKRAAADWTPAEIAAAKERAAEKLVPQLVEAKLRGVAAGKRARPRASGAASVQASAPKIAAAPGTSKATRAQELAAAFKVSCPECGAKADENCDDMPVIGVMNGIERRAPHGERMAAGRAAWRRFEELRAEPCKVCGAPAGARCRDGGQREPGFSAFHKGRA